MRFFHFIAILVIVLHQYMIVCDPVANAGDSDCTLPDQTQCPSPCKLDCFRDLLINGNYTVPNFETFIVGLIRADVVGITDPTSCANIPTQLFLNKFGQQQYDFALEQSKQFCRDRLLFDTSGRYGINEFKIENPIDQADLTGLTDYIEVGYGRLLPPDNENQRILIFYSVQQPGSVYTEVGAEIYLREYVDGVGEVWNLVQTFPVTSKVQQSINKMSKYQKKKSQGQTFAIKKNTQKILMKQKQTQYKRSTYNVQHRGLRATTM